MNQPPSDSDPKPLTPEPGIRQQAENSLLGGMQAIQGKRNIQNRGNNNWTGNTWNNFWGWQEPATTNTRPENQQLLLAGVKHEVTARLRSSLHNEVLINLQKEQQHQQVKRPWDREIKIGLKPNSPLPDTTSILEEIKGKLLLLGTPGSGKTTTQLELAQALIERAENQFKYPIPVLFNLSSWKNNRQPMTEWLVTELKSKYGVRVDIGKAWVENYQLLPLLDGLDELESDRQEPCVQAINQLLEGECRPQHLVVCSRREEYNNYGTRLQLEGAIYLQPLTENQICVYLTAVKHSELWHSVNSDPDLLEIVKIPLLLSVTVLAFEEISIDHWQQLTSTSDRLQFLLDAYVIRMLERNIDSKLYVKRKSPMSKETRLWLVWLSQQLQRESQTEFLIEKMQPTWLLNSNQKRTYSIGSNLIWGLIWFIIYSAINGFKLNFYVIFMAAFSMFIGVASKTRGISDKELITIEKLNFSWKILKNKIQKNGLSLLIVEPGFGILLLGILAALFFSMVSGRMFKSDFPAEPFFFLIPLVLIFVLSLGLINSEVDVKTVPNQGIRKSFENSIAACLVFTLFFTFSFSLLHGLGFGLVSMLNYGTSVGLVAGLGFGMKIGANVCIQHFTLRLILYCNGYIPWNYSRFLDYATERMFLQRVGGRYRFIHKLLQDHFAQMPLNTFK